MEDLTGKQFGLYQIVAPLGEGGMAAVYKAYQPSMERYVAVKVLPRQIADSAEFIARFKREARMLAQLQHPHILPVFDYGESDGYTYIVMSFVQGGTLADLLKTRRMSLPEIRRMMTQIGDALGYAHMRGMIHRDVKPSNVLIDERGNCLLTDFGLARMTEASVHLTSSGAIMGTPAYMSPEQGAGTKLDGRSDIYSLGVILYEMITGQVPYSAETPIAVVLKHIQGPLPSARKLAPELPEELELVLLKSLAKSPTDRYQNAEDFVQAIRLAIPSASGAGKSGPSARTTTAVAAPTPALTAPVSEPVYPPVVNASIRQSQSAHRPPTTSKPLQTYHQPPTAPPVRLSAHDEAQPSYRPVPQPQMPAQKKSFLPGRLSNWLWLGLVGCGGLTALALFGVIAFVFLSQKPATPPPPEPTPTQIIRTALPKPTPTSIVLPKLVDKADIDSGIYANTKYLSDLAKEQYSVAELDKMDTLIYTIDLDQSQNVFWYYGWCANDQATLNQNFQHITVVFTLAGEVIPLNKFQKYDNKQGKQICHGYRTVLTNWHAGEIHLSIVTSIDATINDGNTDYPAGKKTFNFTVRVK